jgi:methyltransferase-like protein
MTLTYTSLEELHRVIAEINRQIRFPLEYNIIYLEELTNVNFIVYIAALRDADAHLGVILGHEDVTTPEAKKNIQYHLQEYYSHLERAFIDTYRKIIDVEYKIMRSAVPFRSRKAVDVQVAEKIAKLRILNVANSEKPAKYAELLRYIEAIRNQFSKPDR